MEPIILASASPRRKDLLMQAGIPFIVRYGNADENIAALDGSPADKAEKLALAKATGIAVKYREESACAKASGPAGDCPERLVLGADTIVVLDEEILGKPEDGEDARIMLSKLNGRVHSVITGIALVDSGSGKYAVGHEVTRVRFAVLTEDEIKAYIRTGEPFGKAGAYAVQGVGALLVDGIEGCYTNVVGLPLMRLRRMLAEFGVKPLA